MSVPIKLQLEQDLRRIKVQPTISYGELVDLLKGLFKQVPSDDWEQLAISYVDNENDSCNVTGELELREAFYAKRNEVLKLELTFKRKEREAREKADRPQQQWRQQCNQTQRRAFWPEQRLNVGINCNPRRLQFLSFHEEGIALMESKKFQQAKEMFEKQLELVKCPGFSWKKSSPLYNIACCEALLGNSDSALAFLAQAISHGFRNVQHIEQDEDLASLRGLDAFEVMLSELRSNAQNQGNKPWRKQKFEREVKQGPILSVNRNDEIPQPIAVQPVIQESPMIPQPIAVQPVIQESPVIPQPINVVPSAVVDSPPLGKVDEPKSVQPLKVDSTYASECDALVAMGFTNVQKNMRTLMKTKGNLSEAVRILLH